MICQNPLLLVFFISNSVYIRLSLALILQLVDCGSSGKIKSSISRQVLTSIFSSNKRSIINILVCKTEHSKQNRLLLLMYHSDNYCLVKQRILPKRSLPYMQSLSRNHVTVQLLFVIALIGKHSILLNT